LPGALRVGSGGGVISGRSHPLKTSGPAEAYVRSRLSVARVLPIPEPVVMPFRRFLWIPVLVLGIVFSACDYFDGDPPEEQIDRNPLPREVADSLFTTTPSGLKYHDFFIGDGVVADSGQAVQVHYHGWFVNDQLFDSSVLRGVPIFFVLGTGQVIKGWDEGLAGMRVGGERQLIIPPNLAYGAAGRGAVPPNATLVFEVIIMAVQ